MNILIPNLFKNKQIVLNTYTTSEADNIINLLDIPSMLSTINNNGTNIVNILNTRYTKAGVYTLISASYNQTETDNMLNQKVNTSGNKVSPGSLEANVFRCGEITNINDDDLNTLALTQLTSN